AIEAVRSAAHAHTFLGHTKHGQTAIFGTTGNPDCHVILRGGRTETNYDSSSITKICEQLKNAGLAPRVMVDCSHANSHRDYTRQPSVCREVIQQIKAGDRHIVGVMLESNLVSGSQKLDSDKPLVYGQSITDACISWDTTAELLREIGAAVMHRASVNELRAILKPEAADSQLQNQVTRLRADLIVARCDSKKLRMD